MIDRVIVENFKCFRKLDISLGRANLLIGENGSGKSSFLDVFHVLRGLSRGLTVAEVFEGKAPDENFSGWTGIRGASAGACYAHGEPTNEVMIEVQGRSESTIPEKWEYLVKFSPTTGLLVRERLKLGSEVCYDYAADSLESSSSTIVLANDLVSRDTGVGSILAQVRQDLGSVGPRPIYQTTLTNGGMSAEKLGQTSRIAKQSRDIANTLASILPLDPSPIILRQSSQSGLVRRLGDRGENFASLVHSICLDSDYKDSFLLWMQELLSEQVKNVGTTRGSDDELIFCLQEHSKNVPATLLSDGTLRFAALLAALFQPAKPSLITLDAIETAIHANRIRLLYLLFWCESEHHRVQTVATTHSPVMLEWMHEDDLTTTFVCNRDHCTGEARITSLPDLPHFMDAFKRGSRTSDMLTESWFETEFRA